MLESKVLIVGAGPTGLTLALWLAKLGVRARIVDKSEGPGTASRAMTVQARTLEFYKFLGCAEDVIAKGIKIEQAHLRKGVNETGVLRFGQLGRGLSPYPFALSLPQDDHERFLVDQLAAAGVHVERQTELTELVENEGSVEVKLRNPEGSEALSCQYVVGCDGAHSSVRELLGVTFSGGTYSQLFYVADVAGEGLPSGAQDMNMCFGSTSFCVVFPIRSTGNFRLIGIVPPHLADSPSLTFEDIRADVHKLVGFEVTTVNWFSTYHVHHRVAERFRQGRVFLAGDAGHIHSPAGGQGMNTGIGDAVNLTWKVAGVVKGELNPGVLDSYEQERIAFAKSLVQSTDRAFQMMVSQSMEALLIRRVFLPYFVPALLKLQPLRRAAFKVLSQTRISYRGSILSSGSTSSVQGGDRLPWVEELDNYAPLQSLKWQIHVYGDSAATPAVPLAVHHFSWTDGARRAGLLPNAAYLIRPDGHIGCCARSEDWDSLEAYWRHWSGTSGPRP
jgi:2-polyprenyl-6-methoxyphenol hydroxylase-like FAD-dependent oxidoreductase